MSGATEVRLDRPGILSYLKRLPLTTLLIGGLLAIILILGKVVGLSIATELTYILRRFSYWSVLVLAMVPAIQSGTGPNFALPVGICAGLLAMVMVMELNLMGAAFIITSMLIAIAIGCVFGYIYGRLMNAVKGSEMAIATYTGFAVTALFSMIWLIYPITNKSIGFFLGPGLRIIVNLETFAANKILENLFAFNLFGTDVPTGTLLVFGVFAFLVYMFFRTKTGTAISAVGMNPVFAKATGVNVDRSRLIANMMSTCLGAVGMIVYAQGFGFAQFYDTPMLMAFPAVASVLVGGASAQRSKVINVIIGCLLFQGLLTSAPPVVGRLLQDTDADITNPVRLIVQFGVILYALTKMSGGEKR
jgi:simple sugar transport system permease protein